MKQWIAIIVLAVIVAGGGVYYHFDSQAGKSAAAATTQEWLDNHFKDVSLPAQAKARSDAKAGEAVEVRFVNGKIVIEPPVAKVPKQLPDDRPITRSDLRKILDEYEARRKAPAASPKK